MKVFSFNSLKTVDLIVDSKYKAGSSGNMSDETISTLMNCSNQGGIRYIGSTKNKTYSFVVLFTTLEDLDCPDELNIKTGRFTYFGDNKHPGNLLH